MCQRPRGRRPGLGRSTVALLLTGLLVAISEPERAHAQNILLVIADDLGVGQLGLYSGEPHPATPTLDQLARDGLLFRNAWANPFCSPTRALIHTGRYSFRTGVVNSVYRFGENGLDLKETTIAEVLAEHGYACALFGKWHLGQYATQGGTLAPNLAGWHHFSGAISGGIPSYYEWPRVMNGTEATCYDYATTANVNDLLAWVEAQQDQPWFAVLAFNAPHTPYHAPPRALHTQNLDGLNPMVTPTPFVRAMIEAMDRELGRCLASLDSNTTVIFIGDNGPPASSVSPDADQERYKGTVYQGGVHVPLIVRSPFVIRPGRVVNAIVHAVDLFATIAELGAATTDAGVDSVSLVPYLLSPSVRPLRSYVYVEVYSDPMPCGIVNVGCQRAVRDDRYKLITKLGRTTRYELYDLWNDPNELNNLLLPDDPNGDSATPFRRLSQQLDAISIAGVENQRRTK